MNDAPASLISGEDCMGNHMGYWEQALFCSDGKVVLGSGLTKESAEQRARLNREDYERLLNTPARQRIKEILNKGEAYPCAHDQGILNRAFAELLGITKTNYDCNRCQDKGCKYCLGT